MTKFNKAKWVAQELAKITAENYVSARAGHMQTITLSEEYGLDISESGAPDLIAAMDAKFAAKPAGLQSLDDLMREEEERLAAEASTPERIAADAAQFERNRAKLAAEYASLEAQGLIDHGSDDDADEDEDEGEEA